MDLRTDILPHRDRLYRIALSITLHTAEAEDVVQDTILRAWEQRNEWPQIQNIGAWLAQICKNLALDRRKHMHHTTSLQATLDQQTSLRTSLAVAPADGIHSEALTILSDLITRLPSPQDDIIRLREIEGLSYREIATALSLTEDQVRVYLHRARQKLKEEYQKIK